MRRERRVSDGQVDRGFMFSLVRSSKRKLHSQAETSLQSVLSFLVKSSFAKVSLKSIL